MKVLVKMTVEEFYSTVFSHLYDGQEVYFCTSTTSSDPKKGEDWLCAERQRLGGTTGEWYSILHACGGCSSCAIVTDKASEVSAEEIAESISTCCSSGGDFTIESEIYVERETKDIIEEDKNMFFVDREIFLDDNEHHIHLEFHDGVAIGRGDSTGLAVVYPTLDRLTEEDVKDIHEYGGLPEKEFITPRDVCLKFGRLIRLNY